jgi:hypothetical protein
MWLSSSAAIESYVSGFTNEAVLPFSSVKEET